MYGQKMDVFMNFINRPGDTYHKLRFNVIVATWRIRACD